MNEILNGNILKIWVKFVVPSVIGVVLNTIYTLIDGIFVGQGVGEAGLASINIVWPAITVIIGIGLMIGIGTSSIIAIHMGKEEQEKSEKTLAVAIKSVIVIGGILMIVGLLFREPILKILGATPDTIDYAKQYYTIMYLMTIPYIYATALNPIIRTDGRPDLSMIMIAIGAICNIILDWLLVIKLDFGIRGAAIATSTSIFISMIVSLYYFIKGSSKIKLRKENFKMDINILKEIIKIGFVSFAIEISYGIILFVQNNVMYAYGDTVDVAIYTVANYINCFIVNTCMGIAQGLQPLIGYHYGAEKIKRMRKLLLINTRICIIGGTLFCIGLLVFGKELIKIYGISGENIDFAYKMVMIYCMGSPIIGVIFTMSAFYQAIGKNLYSNILSIGRGFIFQFIFTMVLPPYIGTIGVFLSLPLSELITIIILICILLIEKSKKYKIQIN